MSKLAAFFAAIGSWFKRAGIAIGKWFKNWFVKVDGKDIIPVRIGRWFKSLFVTVEPATEPKLKTLAKSQGFKTVVASVICAFGGLILGFVIMLFISPAHAWEGIVTVIKGFFNYNRPQTQFKYFGETLAKAAPLIMCAVAVLFAYKAGLFNIGVAGQYTIGIMASLYSALAWQLPWYLCIIIAMLASALWGAFSGAMKAFFGVNEVIACIMTNWIGLYLTNIVLNNEKTMSMSETFRVPATSPSSVIPGCGLDTWFNDKYVTISVIFAIVVAIVVKILLDKTTFGYELKATGFNKHAAKYVGMKDKRNIILTMAISGAIAGLGAAFMYLTDIKYWTISSALPSEAFNGIAVAFLGGLNPIGVLFAGYFIQHVTFGGSQLDTTYFNAQIADLITSLIIYLCAFVLLIRSLLTKKRKDIAATVTNDSAANDADAVDDPENEEGQQL